MSLRVCSLQFGDGDVDRAVLCRTGGELHYTGTRGAGEAPVDRQLVPPQHSEGTGDGGFL